MLPLTGSGTGRHTRSPRTTTGRARVHHISTTACSAPMRADDRVCREGRRARRPQPRRMSRRRVRCRRSRAPDSRDLDRPAVGAADAAELGVRRAGMPALRRTAPADRADRGPRRHPAHPGAPRPADRGATGSTLLGATPPLRARRRRHRRAVIPGPERRAPTRRTPARRAEQDTCAGVVGDNAVVGADHARRWALALRTRCGMGRTRCVWGSGVASHNPQSVNLGGQPVHTAYRLAGEKGDRIALLPEVAA